MLTCCLLAVMHVTSAGYWLQLQLLACCCLSDAAVLINTSNNRGGYTIEAVCLFCVCVHDNSKS